MKSAVNGLKNAQAMTWCFVAGTLVTTADGYKPIEEVQAGDEVLSMDYETGEVAVKTVTQTFVNETDELTHVSVGGEVISATPNHPFYVAKFGWTLAADLRAGDILVLSNGEYVVVEAIQHEILENPIKVYNFEVEDFHTYFVGENSVLVHNDCTPEDLYSFGNKSAPRGARPQQDFDVDSYDSLVYDQSNKKFPNGASTLTDVRNSSMKGQYHELSAGIPLPDGLGIKADGVNVFLDSPHGIGHYTIYPTKTMTVGEFNELFKSLPWEYIGKIS